MTRIRSQRGLAAAAIIIVIILAALTLILGRGIFNKSVVLSQREVTDANFTRIKLALVSHVSQTTRLPCPANGETSSDDLDFGKADPDGTTDTCNAPNGVVPWRTLGLSREQALDGWGRKISYRVFDGAKGFTIIDSLKLTDCNSSLGAPLEELESGTSFCKAGSPPPNTTDQFLDERGNILDIKDADGNVVSKGNAFVLISHGESGYGAYPAEGTSRTTLPNASGSEYVNTLATGTYRLLPRSSPDISPTSASHFDDIVAYQDTGELVKRAQLAARPYSSFALSAQFDESSVEAAAAGFNASSSQNTGYSSLDIGGFRITASAGGTTQNVGFREQGSIGGIGVYSGGADTRGDIDSSFNEKLTFQLGTGSEYGKMDVALNRFQITSTGPPTKKERAEISFWKGGEIVQTTRIGSWDDQDNPTRCLHRLVSGGTFDRMDVAAITQSDDSDNSRFTVAGIKACPDETTPCETSVTGAVACPIPPPSVASVAPSDPGTTTATLSGTVVDSGVAMGTGSGYRSKFSTQFSKGANSIELSIFAGSGTILAGNCVQFQNDSNTYVVTSGVTAAGQTLVIADPGLLKDLDAGFFGRTVTLTQCQTTVSFDYGITGAFGSSKAASPGTINAGSGSNSVSGTIDATCNTGYYFRTKAVGQWGTTTGNCSYFKTDACAFAAPGAITHVPTSIGQSSATFNGSASDNGYATTVWFDYGLTTCYESSVAATPGAVGAGSGSTIVSGAISGLSCGTVYHYRTRAVSVGGTTTGSDQSFQTADCP